MDRGSERKAPHIGTDQPSSVEDDCPTGCKLLLQGDKVCHAWHIAGTLRISIG